MGTEQDQAPGVAAEALPEPGDVLAGKYRVERVVGVGGMGVVVAAVHLQLEERVALKLLKREVMRPDTIGRFLREARAAAKIKSEHVARVTDVGTLASGTPYMVMELLEGEDLGHLVRERGRLPVDRAVDYVLQACEALAEAHALGIVHRDLKPSNLFLSKRRGGQRVVKVVDFGISKQMDQGSAPPLMEDASRTRTSAWLGSPLYMSPEQMRSAKDVDARTDLWSLGLILFELCTGHVPFDAPSLVELCGRVLHDQPTPVAAWLPDPPADLVAVIARCLRKNRDERYASVADFAQALAPLAQGTPAARERIDRIVSITQPPGPPSVAPPRMDEDGEPVLLLRPQVPSAPPVPEPPREAPPEPVAALTTDPPPKPVTEAPAPKPATEAPALKPAVKTPAPKPATETPAPKPATEAPAPKLAVKTSTSKPATEAPAPKPAVKTSTSKPVARTPASKSATEARAVPEEQRRRGGVLLFLLLLVVGGAGGGGYLRYRAHAWPFAAPAPALRDIHPDPPILSTTATTVVVAPPPSAVPPVVSVADAGLDAGALDAGGHGLDAGLDAGAHRALHRAPAGVPEPPSSPGTAPVPSSALRPEVISETCFQTLPNGTRKAIPCP